ncbi:NUDIX hydrolase [Lachnospiraceae bacterium HCP28S3_F9]|uniref:NUDIX hydrolase n=1 Tax=Lachnospiraceae TaxID=186803 RepID=UPI00324200CE
MPSFLSDLSKFQGTGEKNADGKTLEEFLEEYDPYRYQTPSCTTDAVIFAHSGKLEKGLEGLKLLLVKRSNHPSIGYWALPGGFINIKEDLDDTARRELEEETGVKGLVMEQIATYGDYDRDPRARVITTAYMSLVDEKDVKVQAGDDAADAVWCEVGLEMTQTEWTRDCEKNLYTLRIRNKSRHLDTTALVEQTVVTGLIREQKFQVKEMGTLAADHAAIIVHALVLLKNRL